MEIHEQWRVDQAEAAEREFKRKWDLASVVVLWILVVLAALLSIAVVVTA